MLYKFGKYTLNTKEKNLWCDNELINLTPLVFETLCILVERSGEIVSKEYLLETVWEDAFVEENNLSQKISILRKTFGKENNFIETIPRKGFRFVATVTELNEEKLIDKNEFLAEQNQITINNSRRHSAKNVEYENTYFFQRRPILLTLLFIIFLTVGFIGYNHYQTQNRLNEFAPAVKLQSLTDKGKVRYPMISPSGDSMAYIKPDNPNIYIKDIATQSDIEIKIEETFTPGFLRFSPDETYIYFRRKKRPTEISEIYRILKFGGEPELIADNIFAQFDISPDGKKIVFIRKDNAKRKFELTIKDLYTEKEEIILTKEFPTAFSWQSPPSWSPDGKKIAFIHGQNTGDFSKLSVLDIESKTEQIIKTEGIRTIWQTLWLGSNNKLLMLAKDSENRIFQIFQITYPSSRIRKLSNDLTAYRNLSVSQDGKRIVARTHGIYSNIWFFPNGDKTNGKQLTEGESGIEGLFGIDWTPNGKIVHHQYGNKSSQLQILDPFDNSSRILTTNTAGVTQFPSVTSDGKTVFYQSTEKGIKKIKSVEIESGDTQILDPNTDQTQLFPVVSSDDNWLYFLQRSKDKTVICRQSLKTNKKEIVYDNALLSVSSFLSISPNGKHLAFNTEKSDNNNGTKIGFIDLENNFKVNYLSVPLSRPYIQWTNDGQTFDYFSDTKNGSQLWRQSFLENSKPELILETNGEKIYFFAWSKDENNLAMSIGNNKSDAVLFEIN